MTEIPDTVTIAPGVEPTDDPNDPYVPSVQLQHDAKRRELHVIVMDEASGMAEGVPAEAWEQIVDLVQRAEAAAAPESTLEAGVRLLSAGAAEGVDALLRLILTDMPHATDRDLAADGPVGDEEGEVWRKISECARVTRERIAQPPPIDVWVDARVGRRVLELEAALRWIATYGRNEEILTETARECDDSWHLVDHAEGGWCPTCCSDWWVRGVGMEGFNDEGSYTLQAVARKALQPSVADTLDRLVELKDDARIPPEIADRQAAAYKADNARQRGEAVHDEIAAHAAEQAAWAVTALGEISPGNLIRITVPRGTPVGTFELARAIKDKYPDNLVVVLHDDVDLDIGHGDPGTALKGYIEELASLVGGKVDPDACEVQAREVEAQALGTLDELLVNLDNARGRSPGMAGGRDYAFAEVLFGQWRKRHEQQEQWLRDVAATVEYQLPHPITADAVAYLVDILGRTVRKALTSPPAPFPDDQA